jgi:asparagine synthase (glutamine-hydrolysing)
MCGIVGIVSNSATSLNATLNAMVASQHHRGPDESGTFKSEKCLLGHNRLSIVDLGSGQQPMASHDGRYTIVFNGEIYGYKKLKKGLQYNFKTQSDTEVILAMYIAYGEKMLSSLTGMFAFAIWDSLNEELFFARDRVGEKPFYYSQTDSDFIFASEVNTLAKSNLISIDIDMVSVGHYLSKLYIHPNHSIYKNIHSLPAGHCGVFKNGSLKISQYWHPSAIVTNISYLSAIEELEHLFTNALQDQLIADVPVSVFLSGGLDSSTVAAYAAKQQSNIEALCFRFKSGLDEGGFAQDVATKHNIRIRELWENNDKNIAELIVNSVECYAEPYADSSSIPTMMICKEAVKHSKVVLSGDGADELFGGYVNRYRPTIYMEKLLGKNPARIKAARLIYGAMNKAMSNENFFAKSQAAKYIGSGHDIASALDETSSIYKDSELARFGLSRQQPNWPEARDSVNSGMMLDILNYLPGDILVKTDRAAMAVGLEVRAPFLAKEIIEFALGLPADYKITSSNDKKIMRDCFSHLWPDSVKNRSKQGFGSPVVQWLADSSVIDLKEHVFSSGAKIYSLLDKELINSNKNRLDMKGWAMLNLAVWCSNFPYEISK